MKVSDDISLEEMERYWNSAPPSEPEAPEGNVLSIRDGKPVENAEQADADALPGAMDPGEWAGWNAPERRFVIPGWLIRGSGGLLSGEEGVGKSLLAQQMATCAGIGHAFLGLDIEQVPAVYITCEDSMEELWRRQEAINATLGITMADLTGKLLLVSLKGQLGNELAEFDSAGHLKPCKRYEQIKARVVAFNAGLVFLDNAAHFFSGNENSRQNVAAFLGLIEALSELIDGSVVVLAHPNKAHAQGNTQGNEFSGSTGWSAHVRNRLYLGWKPAADGEVSTDLDARILRKSKANYGKKGEEIEFRWHAWAFTTLTDLPADTAREIAQAAENATLNALFLKCLAKATEERRTTSTARAASNFAPRVFAKMTIGKGASEAAFEAAMERLLHLETIKADQRVYQRENRSWAMGIGCTNPCTNHAQSGAQSLHRAATEHDTKLHAHVPPSTTYIGEPLEASPNMYVPDPPAWMDEAPPSEPDKWRGNPLLNSNWKED